MFWRSLLSVVGILFGAWFAYSVLGALHWSLQPALFAFAFVNVTTIWLLHKRSTLIDSATALPFVRDYVRFVSRVSGEPRQQAKRKSGLKLGRRRDFDLAVQTAASVVRGHNAVIERLLAVLFENLTLRKRHRFGAGKGPLGAFLLIGSEGVGKRYLSRVIAKLLYENAEVESLDCRLIDVEKLVGRSGQRSPLLTTIERFPHTLLLLEHVDQATSAVTELIVELLTTGHLHDKDQNKPVSFEHATVVCTTTTGTEVVCRLQEDNSSPTTQQKTAIDHLIREHDFHHRLLNAVTEIFYCAKPDDRVKSEVIALLMAKECKKHTTQLAYVEPEIIATQVVQINDENGFAVAPQLVEKLLRRPLVEAVAGDHKTLSLHLKRH